MWFETDYVGLADEIVSVAGDHASDSAEGKVTVVVFPSSWKGWWIYVPLVFVAGIMLVVGYFFAVRRVLCHRRRSLPPASPPLPPGKSVLGTELHIKLKQPCFTTADERFLQRATDCVYRHLDDVDFGQQVFAEEMGISKSTLYKKLTMLTGLNTTGFVRKVRLNASCALLNEKGRGVRISEVAYAVGFSDPKYFSLCFKREFHVSPSEYVERIVCK